MTDRYIRFTRLISSITRNIRRITLEAASRYGIKRSYVPCIYFLYTGGPMTASKLSRLCGEDKANISRTIHALEEDGIALKCERTSSRARQKMTLTDEGRSIGGFLVDRIDEAVEIATHGVSAEEREAMYSVLTRINNNLVSMLSDIDSTE